ncbi:MAG: squalene--hopene cyclase, partial [Pirellulaceae bacterium]
MNAILRNFFWLQTFVVTCLMMAGFSHGQTPDAGGGDTVPRDVREMYDRGLQYLVKTQDESGAWTQGSEMGGGSTGLALMALLASGEDPNFGIYRTPIRKAIRSILQNQNSETGYVGNSMYHHGFAMLAL